MSNIDDQGPAKFQWSRAEEEKPERTVIVVPDITSPKYDPKSGGGQNHSGRTIEARLEEAEGLANAIALDVMEAVPVRLKTTRAATLFGTGKVAELGELIKSHDAGLAIVDHTLSPVQQQNLEEAWQCKILDRTGLILEIFGERAKTKEGRLQVELAHLDYQKGRLVRQWTHLERQRGGAGFMGGPGETQIEADRREIQSKILSLKRELEKVRKTRRLHRAQRHKVPYPVVALVGYTNAGKSTLFNKLTGAGVVAKDQLFATLDPTMRQLQLPQGTKIILSDTVGFVSNLPTHLVAAFRATLEEVIEADVILHVRDIADPDTNAQRSDVNTILQQLGIDNHSDTKMLEVWNKIDLLEADRLQALDASSRTTGGEIEDKILVSSLTGKGIDEMLELIEENLTSTDAVSTIDLAIEQLGHLNWIYQNTTVASRQDNEDGSLTLTIRAKPDVVVKLNSMLGIYSDESPDDDTPNTDEGDRIKYSP